MIDLGNFVTRMDLFLLVLVRMSGLFILSPIFGRQNMPAIFKIGFSFMLAVIFMNALPIGTETYFQNIYQYMVLIIREFAIGLVMGYITYAVMSAIYVAGQLIDTQVGFGIANVMDPISNIQIPLTSNFYYIFIILVFLLLNGHHMLVRALFQSFEAIPVGQFAVTGEFLTLTISIITTMFLVAIKISAPIIAAIFITDIVLGVLSKTMPEMNVFALGMPLKIIIGLLIMMLTVTAAVGIGEGMVSIMEQNLMYLFKMWNGG